MISSSFLDELTQRDLPQVMRLYTDAQVREFLGGPIPEQVAQERALGLLRTNPPHFNWAIRRASDRRFLGVCSLGPHHDGIETELSVLLLPEHQGRGHATAALKAVLEYAFGTLRLNKVVAETQRVNAQSVRLLERIGMALERSAFRFGAAQSIYAITAS